MPRRTATPNQHITKQDKTDVRGAGSIVAVGQIFVPDLSVVVSCYIVRPMNITRYNNMMWFLGVYYYSESRAASQRRPHDLIVKLVCAHISAYGSYAHARYLASSLYPFTSSREHCVPVLPRFCWVCYLYDTMSCRCYNITKCN